MAKDINTLVSVRPKSIFSFSAVNENADENEVPFTAKNETKMDIHFRPKNENESHLITLVFFSFSYIQSPSQPYNAPPIPRPVSPFLRGPCWRDSTFLLHSVSLWHFSRWHLSTQLNSTGHVTLTAKRDQKKGKKQQLIHIPYLWSTHLLKLFTVLQSTACCVSAFQWLITLWLIAIIVELSTFQLVNSLLSLTKCHGVPCSLPSRITTKVLKNCKTFSSRPRPRPWLHDPRPMTFVFVLAPRDQLKTLRSRGLYAVEHCKKESEGTLSPSLFLVSFLLLPILALPSPAAN